MYDSFLPFVPLPLIYSHCEFVHLERVFRMIKSQVFIKHQPLPMAKPTLLQLSHIYTYIYIVLTKITRLSTIPWLYPFQKKKTTSPRPRRKPEPGTKWSILLWLNHPSGWWSEGGIHRSSIHPLRGSRNKKYGEGPWEQGAKTKTKTEENQKSQEHVLFSTGLIFFGGRIICYCIWGQSLQSSALELTWKGTIGPAESFDSHLMELFQFTQMLVLIVIYILGKVFHNLTTEKK